MKKPYLLSIGIGMPLFGVWAHRYVPVKRKYGPKSLNLILVRVVWTSYRRRLNEEDQSPDSPSKHHGPVYVYPGRRRR